MATKLNGMLGPIITIAALLASGLIAYGVMKGKLTVIAKNETRSLQTKEDVAVLTVLMQEMAKDIKVIRVEVEKPRGILGRIND